MTSDTPVRHTFHSQIAAAIRRQPVTATPETTVREAVAQMAEARVGSIVVVEPESGRPIGIFTLRDLLHRVVAVSGDLDQMLMAVMSGGELLMVNWRSTLYQAALLMARHDVHHVIVVDATGKTAGVVSQDDIQELQSGGGKAVADAIRGACEPGDLVAAAADIRRLGERMVMDGVAAEPLTQRLSSLNDHLTVRILELTAREIAPPAVPWCWLSFGSEGRFEQTLATDQDNGILFAAGRDDAEAVRQGFLPFARAVNERLAACGFPLCKGNVMASNPALCLSLDEWRGKFFGWLQASHPQALLDATIYFDFRPLHGDEELAEELRAWVVRNVPEHTLFLRFMAENAVGVSPPLGLLRDFICDADHTLDLKISGGRLFVDVARIMALAGGHFETGTAERLRAVAAAGKLGGEDLGAIVDGFYFIQQLRLRQQLLGLGNRVDPRRLNELDRLILKAALKQAKKLQGRLGFEYHL